MAVLAPTDWHPPRDLSMDAPTNAINTSVPRQRSSPANDPSGPSTPVSQQPYPYPVQQQQAGWQSPHPQQQYYPSFYQNHHQQAYQLHAHPGQGPMHAQSPYYDPANAQFAQWAYQQMMFNAHHQAHQMSHVPSPQHSGQRSRSASASTGEYFVPPQVQGYNPFPSGTPPAHPSQLPPNAYASAPSDQSPHQSQYSGYHPYRRPNRQGSQHQESSQATPPGDWRGGPFQPPYARTDAAGSSTSVNSASSHSGSSRHRTNSLQGSSAPSASGGKSPPPAGNGRSSNSTAPAPSTVPNASRPHQRTGSAASNASSAVSRPSVASSSTASSASTVPSAIRKPSPLSQGNFTAAEKRMSRDDSDLAAMLEPAPGVRSGGLKGRLRRALSLNAGTTLREEDEDEQAANGSRRTAAASSSSSTVMGDDESTATVQKKKSKSLFNSRLNRSTDNISLSSTMSSASMVIRKLGNLGKLTRRNSLAGITSIFKDKDKDKKDKDKEGEEGKKGKKKKDGKGQVSEPSVSHATAELDPAEWSPDMNGLSPAARLARQHTLKSNAEAAAKAKAEQEAKAAAAAQASGGVPGPWEKNTTTRAENAHGKGLTRINEDGSRVLVEDDDSDEEGHGGQGGYNQTMEGWEEDDDDWGEAQGEDDTIRQSLDAAHLDDEEMEPWAMNIRRSEERTRKPAKGILKMRPDGTNYDQDAYAARSTPSAGRHRANSYDSSPSHGNELGPLAHIPSNDPDHIDGLHKHSHTSSPASQPSFLPPLSFESKSLTVESPKDSDTSTVRAPSPAEKTLFSHPNSSAPALSTMFNPNAPTLTQRSATAPTKRLAFATNLSVYDTFPAAVYDRRSEPATWSRLTPTLAQRIKEELNSYKMEEMEVHAASRVHTQFFV